MQIAGGAVMDRRIGLAVRLLPAYKRHTQIMQTSSSHASLAANLAAVLGFFLLVQSVTVCAEPAATHVARMTTDKLRLVIADNEAYAPDHRAGYSGVAELCLAPDGSPNLFVPLYAGLNYEHIFSGDESSYAWNIFEPRRAPMQLVQLVTNRVELRQARTEHWPLRSRLVYEANNDAVDLAFHATPLADAWKKHGYIGVFFASYIQSPEDMAIQFIGRSRAGRGDARVRWIKLVTERHGVAANHRPAGSQWDPTFDPDFKVVLANGFSDYEYFYPFYFGRSGENVFVMMFERTGAEGEMRFAQSPSGGGKGNPAWDFVYFRRDYAVGREFSFRVRAVYRRFTSLEDVVKVYEAWSGETVKRPE